MYYIRGKLSTKPAGNQWMSFFVYFTYAAAIPKAQQIRSLGAHGAHADHHHHGKAGLRQGASARKVRRGCRKGLRAGNRLLAEGRHCWIRPAHRRRGLTYHVRRRKGVRDKADGGVRQQLASSVWHVVYRIGFYVRFPVFGNLDVRMSRILPSENRFSRFRT